MQKQDKTRQPHHRGLSAVNVYSNALGFDSQLFVTHAQQRKECPEEPPGPPRTRKDSIEALLFCSDRRNESRFGGTGKKGGMDRTGFCVFMVFASLYVYDNYRGVDDCLVLAIGRIVLLLN